MRLERASERSSACLLPVRRLTGDAGDAIKCINEGDAINCSSACFSSKHSFPFLYCAASSPSQRQSKLSWCSHA